MPLESTKHSIGIPVVMWSMLIIQKLMEGKCVPVSYFVLAIYREWWKLYGVIDKNNNCKHSNIY